ncbi:ATP-grasp fold amidoligase family protein [Sulfitobacter sp. MOLA879]
MKPSTFLEYIQYLKYYGRGGELGPFVDKVLAKDFARRRIGEEYVIPTIKVIRANDPIDLSDLPEHWIAKSAHAAGWNYIHKGSGPVSNKVLRKMGRWLERNYFDVSGETNYRYIPPKILFEPLISEPEEDLKDYKIWCFAGEPKLIGVHGDRAGKPKGEIFDLNWNRTDWTYPEVPSWPEKPEKPRNLDLLLNLARTLSEGFPFVRVDLYDGSKGVFFGELTFTPGDGSNIRIPLSEDIVFGEQVLAAKPDRSVLVSYNMELF